MTVKISSAKSRSKGTKDNDKDTLSPVSTGSQYFTKEAAIGSTSD